MSLGFYQVPGNRSTLNTHSKGHVGIPGASFDEMVINVIGMAGESGCTPGSDDFASHPHQNAAQQARPGVNLTLSCCLHLDSPRIGYAHLLEI